ncbi:MAG: methyltransferase [Muribaculaceae bacterium]|nr:methyltransferase [Muribaculaceae bacterium]
MDKPFRFKQFNVQHQRSSMKVGTDAVLLGAWCGIEGARRVLDVGTGCGVIALMVAQRNADATILAIDIDPASVNEAQENFDASPWAVRLRACRQDFNDLTDDEGFDLIVTNPPYYNEDVLPPDAVRSAARHTHALSFEQLMQGAARLLTPTGSIALITPVEARDAVTTAATFAGLHLSRLTTVHSSEGKQPKRLLWQWSKQRCTIQRDMLILHQKGGAFTSQYTELCKDFYLDP